jgi:hypothetical protein
MDLMSASACGLVLSLELLEIFLLEGGGRDWGLSQNLLSSYDFQWYGYGTESVSPKEYKLTFTSTGIS